MTEQDAHAEATRRNEESGSKVCVPVEIGPGVWDLALEEVEKPGLLRSLGRALRDGTYG